MGMGGAFTPIPNTMRRLVVLVHIDISERLRLGLFDDLEAGVALIEGIKFARAICPSRTVHLDQASGDIPRRRSAGGGQQCYNDH